MPIQATLPPQRQGESQEERRLKLTRRRYQSGCLFKRGKLRKVWVARWREDVIKPNGSQAESTTRKFWGLSAIFRRARRLKKFSMNGYGHLTVADTSLNR